MRKWITLGFVAAAVAVAPAYAQCGSCGGCGQAGATAVPAALASLSFVSTGGDTVVLGNFLGRQPAVLLVAGTDSLSRAAAQLVQRSAAGAEQGAPVFIGVFGTSRKNAAGMAAGLKLDYLVLPDPAGKLAAALGAKSLPAIAFYDRTGKQVKLVTQPSEETMKEGIKLTAGVQKLVDPVCGMTVTKETAAGSASYQGKTYYFCSKACHESFTKNPDKYLSQ